MKATRRPALLIRLDDEKHADSPQVRNVALAVRLARHTAQGLGQPGLARRRSRRRGSAAIESSADAEVAAPDRRLTGG